MDFYLFLFPQEISVLTDFDESQIFMRVQISFWHPNESQTFPRAPCLAEQELLGVELF